MAEDWIMAEGGAMEDWAMEDWAMEDWAMAEGGRLLTLRNHDKRPDLAPHPGRSTEEEPWTPKPQGKPGMISSKPC